MTALTEEDFLCTRPIQFSCNYRRTKRSFPTSSSLSYGIAPRNCSYSGYVNSPKWVTGMSQDEGVCRRRLNGDETKIPIEYIYLHTPIYTKIRVHTSIYIQREWEEPLGRGPRDLPRGLCACVCVNVYIHVYTFIHKCVYIYIYKYVHVWGDQIAPVAISRGQTTSSGESKLLKIEAWPCPRRNVRTPSKNTPRRLGGCNGESWLREKPRSRVEDGQKKTV